MSNIKVGIVGSEGYVVRELYHLLKQHPDVRLTLCYAPSKAGQSVNDIFLDHFSERELFFTDEADFGELDLLFLCQQSGLSRDFLTRHNIPDDLNIIDFSKEFRHADPDETGFVYGLPEVNRRALTQTKRATVPGSFAMATEIPLIPLAKHLLLNNSVHSFSVAGKTEVFSRPEPTRAAITYDMLFDSFQAHMPLHHPHAEEVRTTLRKVQSSFDADINMVPIRGAFNRGMYTTTYMKTRVDVEQIRALYKEYFHDHSFIRIVDRYPDVRDTINTNAMNIHLSEHEGRLLIVSSMDNLMKGGAGTAVHIMNLMFGLVETTGLSVKPSLF